MHTGIAPDLIRYHTDHSGSPRLPGLRCWGAIWNLSTSLKSLWRAVSQGPYQRLSSVAVAGTSSNSLRNFASQGLECLGGDLESFEDWDSVLGVIESGLDMVSSNVLCVFETPNLCTLALSLITLNHGSQPRRTYTSSNILWRPSSLSLPSRSAPSISKTIPFLCSSHPFHGRFTSSAAYPSNKLSTSNVPNPI